MDYPPGAPFTPDRLPEGVEPSTRSDPDEVGPYRIVGRVGAGGMGAVYAGLAPDGTCAAVKVIHPQYAGDPEFRERFSREVETVARVKARCTPALLGADTSGSTPWLATEYVEGLTLCRYVTRHKELKDGFLTALASGLAEALVAIHSVGVVHRDLKPGNVILAPDGPKVLDFGIARAADGTALTAMGGLLGTPGWMAPEQYLGEEATPRSDVFSWGALVAFAATGRDPFGRGVIEAVSYRSRHGEPDVEGLSGELRSLVLRAMAKDPEERPTAEQLLLELTAYWQFGGQADAQVQQPTRVVPALLATEWREVVVPGLRTRSGRWRRPATAALAATAAVVGVGWWALAPVDTPISDAPAGGMEEDPPAGAEGKPAVEIAPEDASSVISEAIGSLEEAGSHEVIVRDRSGGPSTYTAVHRSTEDPEPRLQVQRYGGAAQTEIIRVGAGPDDVLHRTVSAPAEMDDERFGYYRDAAREAEPDGGISAPEAATEGILMLGGASVEAEHTGYEEVPHDDEPEGLMIDPDTSGRTGHHYQGTFEVGAQEAAERVLHPEGEYGFDLWVGTDGQPLRLNYFLPLPDGGATEGPEAAGGHGFHVFFVNIDASVEIDLPPEDEIADSMAEANPER